jgi:hypothetical protein
MTRTCHALVGLGWPSPLPPPPEAADRLCAAVGEEAAALPPSLADFRQRMLQRRLIEAWCASGGVYTKFTASPKEAEVSVRPRRVLCTLSYALVHYLPVLFKAPPFPSLRGPFRVQQLRPVVAALWKTLN